MKKPRAFSIPASWRRLGLVIPRNREGFGTAIMGDPCIVWDDEIENWRMFVFALPPGHGHARCETNDPASSDSWIFEGPLDFANPGAVPGGLAFKPFVVMDLITPNHPARIDGRYCLVFGTGFKRRSVMRAWSDSLSGPWRVEPGPLIPHGDSGDFDEKHAEAPSGYYFSERAEFLYFYMAHPLRPQDRSRSPSGSALAVAVQGRGEPEVRKLGPVLEPSVEDGHWASGWVGGLQLLPGAEHRWIGLVNASPAPPQPESPNPMLREEPPPSLGGFAISEEEWPVAGWRWCDQPIEWIDDIPEDARSEGEQENLWRQHLLLRPGEAPVLYYNSGPYGREQIYAKVAIQE